MIERSIDVNFVYKTLNELPTLILGVHFYHVSMGNTYDAYHVMLVWPELFVDETAGLNFCALVLPIGEVNELSQKISEN